MKLPIQAAPIVRHNFANSNQIKTFGVQPQGSCFSLPNCPLEGGNVLLNVGNLGDCCTIYPNGSFESGPDNNCQNCPPPAPPNSPASSTSSDFTFGQRTPSFGSLP